ncbi:MAG: hypothetical protein GXC73_05115 [Chitinophagaceae bacterium]|nr:hypothetical protein [Chitinophagaceae bacterium]
MKSVTYLLAAAMLILSVVACEKKDYPVGLSEYEHHYYAIFVPNNNSAVTVSRSQAALLKFPVQFYSTFTRSYDAVARYAVTTAGMNNPAVRGQDFDIVDKNGVVIPSADTSYNIIFPQAKQAMDTIYIKLLNNAAPGSRRMEIQILENKTAQFYVDVFSTAFRRPVTIN